MGGGRGKRCAGRTEVYSRVTGYYQPVQRWNDGKVAEFHDRRPYRADQTPTLAPEGKPADVALDFPRGMGDCLPTITTTSPATGAESEE